MSVIACRKYVLYATIGSRSDRGAARKAGRSDFWVVAAMASVKHSRKASKQGIGLFEYWQVRNTTPFQYFAQVVIGTILASLGIAIGYVQYQSPIRSVGWLLTSAAGIVVGVFMAHAGAIFWYRRLRKI